MSSSRYFIEVLYTRAGDDSPAWHSSDHGTLQAALGIARRFAEDLGAENVALFDRSPTRVGF